MASLTVGEIRQLKRSTEEKIREILIDFANRTQLHVDGVRFGLSLTGFGEEKVADCTSLSIDVQIDDY